MIEKYMNAKEAAAAWGISLHRVQELCKKGRIQGVARLGRAYMIPMGAKKPEDTRCKGAKKDVFVSPKLFMPKKTPFLEMTDLYTKAGAVDECIRNLASNPEVKELLSAEIAYSRGEIDKVIESAKELLHSRSGFYAVNAGGIFLALAAMWKGDIALYRQAKTHICSAPWKTPEEEQIMQLSLACIHSAVNALNDYPDWFIKGQFDRLHPDAHPAAKVFYIKYCIIAAQEHAKGAIKVPDVTGMGLMRVVPYIAEPLMSRIVSEKLVIPEIYLRLLVGIAYHQLGEDESAIIHIDKAIDLALPDRLLGILAEHRRDLDNLLDDRLALKDEKALVKLKELHKGLTQGWTKLHNALLGKNVSNALTVRQREMCRFAAFGLSDKEIAARMKVEPSHVKKELFLIMNKTGAQNRKKLGAYV